MHLHDICKYTGTLAKIKKKKQIPLQFVHSELSCCQTREALGMKFSSIFFFGGIQVAAALTTSKECLNNMLNTISSYALHRLHSFIQNHNLCHQKKPKKPRLLRGAIFAPLAHLSFNFELQYNLKAQKQAFQSGLRHLRCLH